jgi:ribonuclease HI
MNEWIEAWVKRDFAKVKNPDLWRDYLVVSKPHSITGVWVRGHDGHPENERCDQIAREEAEKFKIMQKD